MGVCGSTKNEERITEKQKEERNNNNGIKIQAKENILKNNKTIINRNVVSNVINNIQSKNQKLIYPKGKALLINRYDE